MPRLQFNQARNRFNKEVQTIVIIDDNNKETRQHYLSTDRALELLNNEVNFNVGTPYIIKVLTSDGWRAMVPFTYQHDTDLNRHFYNEEAENEMYAMQGLEREDIRIYAIRIEEVEPNR